MVRTITSVCAAIDKRQTSFLCRREEFKKPVVNDKIKPNNFLFKPDDDENIG